MQRLSCLRRHRSTFAVKTLLLFFGRGWDPWLSRSKHLYSITTMWDQGPLRLKLLTRSVFIVLVLQRNYKCIFACEMNFVKSGHFHLDSDFLPFTFFGITKRCTWGSRSAFLGLFEGFTWLGAIDITWIGSCLETWWVLILSDILDALSITH